MVELADLSPTDWLQAQDRFWWTGFDVTVGERAVWILHAMYEHPGLPGGLSHDDEHRIERAVEPPQPPAGVISREAWEALQAATVIGCPDGRSARPGPEWRRLLWRDHARRLGTNPFMDGRLPSHRSFPHRSWPANVRPPAEGALDREQYRRLLEQLASHSPEGDRTPCFAVYAACWEVDRARLFHGDLRSARDHYDERIVDRGAPNNIWPQDRSWLTYTSYDLWATRVTGPARLIAALTADPGLETVELDVRQPAGRSG